MQSSELIVMYIQHEHTAYVSFIHRNCKTSLSSSQSLIVNVSISDWFHSIFTNMSIQLNHCISLTSEAFSDAITFSCDWSIQLDNCISVDDRSIWLDNCISLIEAFSLNYISVTEAFTV
jgi:hypothetical protein